MARPELRLRPIRAEIHSQAEIAPQRTESSKFLHSLRPLCQLQSRNPQLDPLLIGQRQLVRALRRMSAMPQTLDPSPYASAACGLY
jgi:hypothetical protein